MKEQLGIQLQAVFFITFWFCVLPDIGSGDFVNGLLKGWNAYDKV